MKRILLISVVLTAMLLTGCAVSPEPKPFPPPEGYSSWEEYQKEFDKKATIAPVQVTPTPTQPQIPVDVSYEIIKIDTADITRSLDVQLNKRVSEDVLRIIALELKAQEPRSYERTFILYYLPNMIVDS